MTQGPCTEHIRPKRYWGGCGREWVVPSRKRGKFERKIWKKNRKIICKYVHLKNALQLSHLASSNVLLCACLRVLWGEWAVVITALHACNADAV